MEHTTLKKLQKILLLCGILSTILYFFMDILGSIMYKGYSYTDMTISELSAIGAPTSLFWTYMIFIFNPLLIAFGIGVFLSSNRKRSLQLTGILLAIWGILGFVWLFFPMHMRGYIGSTSDTGHLVLAGLTVLLMTLFIIFGSGAKGKGFRIYSILTLLIMLIFGALTGAQASRVAAVLPTPGLGILERISVFTPMIWVLVLGIVLLRKD